MPAICSIKSFGAVTMTAWMRESATAVTWVAFLMRSSELLLPPAPFAAATAAAKAKPPGPPPPAAETDGRLGVVTRFAARENTAQLGGHIGRIGVFQMEHADFRLRLGAVIHRLDDFGQMPDVGLGVGDHDGVAGFIGDNRRLRRNERRQIRDQLPRLHEPDGNDLRGNLIVVGNGVWVVAGLDRNVARLRVILAP